MKGNLNKKDVKKNIYKSNYIDCQDFLAVFELKTIIRNLLSEFNKKNKIIILCIGTDRATGDSLGPLVGYKLAKLPFNKNILIYGTLEEPIHAKNLDEKIEIINNKYKNKTIIAIDAALGNKNYINYISVGKGSIKPGAGINKDLKEVGDIFIKGIVNISSEILEISILQNTRLSVVMNMADVISSGLWISLNSSFK